MRDADGSRKSGHTGLATPVFTGDLQATARSRNTTAAHMPLRSNAGNVVYDYGNFSGADYPGRRI
jgi:hypothetical protein